VRVTRAWLFALCASCGFSPPGAATGDAGSATGSASCNAGDHQCAGRVLQTCGADGMWDPTQDHNCEFTCAASACVQPSNIDLPTVNACNDLGTAPPLDPGPNGTVTYQMPGPELVCSPACGSVMTIAPAETTVDGEAWFCVSSINLQAGAKLVVGPMAPKDALGFIVDTTATIAGRISVDGQNAIQSHGGGGPGGIAGPGGFTGAVQDDSVGANGQGSAGGDGGDHMDCQSSGNWAGGGGGGGGNFGSGASGGAGGCSQNTVVNGGGGGPAEFAHDLIPLVGGGGGGGGGDATGGVGDGWAGGGGGGAVQIAARLSISIAGEISAAGGNGFGGATTIDGGGGGGGGGGVLLESPMVMIAGAIVVDGGNGGPSGAGSPGGMGATSNAAAMPGTSFDPTMRGGGTGGGGGGGLVMLRGVNAQCSANISPVASCQSTTLAAALGFDSLSGTR